MPRAKRDNNGKRQFKYVDTFDLYDSLLPEKDASLPRPQRRRVQRAAGFRNYLKRTKKVRRFLPPDPILKQITGFEYQLLMNLCHIAIYRKFRFFGVCISIRDFAALLPGRNSNDKVNAAIQQLISLNLVAVLEPSRGSRARILMPNPSGEAWVPPPLCTEQNDKGNLCTGAPNTKEQGESLVSSSGGTQRTGPPVKRKTLLKEIAPPPPAQKGQGGAEEKDPTPGNGVPSEVAFAQAKDLCGLPNFDERDTKQQVKASTPVGPEFNSLCATARLDPEVVALQRRLEEARRARGVPLQ